VQPKTTSFVVCPGCGAQLPLTLVSCPSCHQLVHADRLKQLAQQAEIFNREQRSSEALMLWREALELLPPGSRQHEAIQAKVQTLSRQLDSSTGTAAHKGGAPSPSTPGTHASHLPKWLKGSAGLVAIGLLLWKLKFVVLFVLTKAKLLLLGLTKASTLFSMLLSFGVYWTAWGWKFALGLIVSIYVHEMGHVAALHRYGIKASAPMFIPGLGAVVRLRQSPSNPREDARVGLAGPLWGLGAALAAYAIFLVTGEPFWAATARVGAWINLFNLLPIWQLDGSRGFRALSAAQRWWVVSAMGVMLILTAEGLLILLLLVAGFRAFRFEKVEEPDRLTLLQFILLVVALSLLCRVPVPGTAM
jgi:Zn-dependent protease